MWGGWREGGKVNNHHCLCYQREVEKNSVPSIFFCLPNPVLQCCFYIAFYSSYYAVWSGKKYMITVLFIPICLPPVPAWDLFARHQISNRFLLNKSCCQCCQATTLSSSTLIYISGCHFVAKLGFPCKIQHLSGPQLDHSTPTAALWCVTEVCCESNLKLLRREPSAWTSPRTQPSNPELNNGLDEARRGRNPKETRTADPRSFGGWS